MGVVVCSADQATIFGALCLSWAKGRSRIIADGVWGRAMLTERPRQVSGAGFRGQERVNPWAPAVGVGGGGPGSRVGPGLWKSLGLFSPSDTGRRQLSCDVYTLWQFRRERLAGGGPAGSRLRRLVMVGGS